MDSTDGTDWADNAFTLNLKEVGPTYVIGVSNGAASAILEITRLGDYQQSDSEAAEWIIYEPTVTITDYTVPANTTLTYVDITAETSAYTLVFNETDGFYHLGSANGPLVLVNLGESARYGLSLQNALNYSDVRREFYDEDGNFIKKENYSDCLRQYIEAMDQVKGVYPLTKDLEYILKNYGDSAGWWKENGFLTSQVDGLNTEIAWMAVCCIAE